MRETMVFIAYPPYYCIYHPHIRNTMQKISFSLQGEYIELNQLLKVTGVCDSGGAGKMIVASGNVKVDGQQELRKTCKIRAGQVVSLDDIRISVVAE